MTTIDRIRPQATLTLDNGTKRCVQLKQLEDFFNGVVPEGKPILLVTKTMKVAQGAFVSFENPADGEYLVYIRPHGAASCSVFHIDHLVAYAYDTAADL